MTACPTSQYRPIRSLPPGHATRSWHLPRSRRRGAPLSSPWILASPTSRQSYPWRVRSVAARGCASQEPVSRVLYREKSASAILSMWVRNSILHYVVLVYELVWKSIDLGEFECIVYIYIFYGCGNTLGNSLVMFVVVRVCTVFAYV